MKNRTASLPRSLRSRPGLLAVAVLALLAVGCRQDMHDQAKFEPYEASEIFADGSSARVPPPFTVARDSLDESDPVYTGEDENGWLAAVPYQVDEVFLRRGQSRFDIYCSPCHDRSGGGRGMIVQRGFKQPPSYHEERLREMPIGYFYSIATNGHGLMSGYAGQVNVQDRWAIAAWVRVLQRSQYVPEGRLSDEERDALVAAETSNADAARAGAL